MQPPHPVRGAHERRQSPPARSSIRTGLHHVLQGAAGHPEVGGHLPLRPPHRQPRSGGLQLFRPLPARAALHHRHPPAMRHPRVAHRHRLD
ncbi:MAG: hypothetical protein MZV65_35325 [Chromatiales bacterium]|nr:hypothetical protein [Chromatiales bacterium]